MNIVEAFNKLKENPELTIKFKDYKFIIIFGILNYIKGCKFYEINPDEIYFNLEEVLSNDWEVIEND